MAAIGFSALSTPDRGRGPLYSYWFQFCGAWIPAFAGMTTVPWMRLPIRPRQWPA